MQKSLLLLALAFGCLALPGLGQEPEEVKLLDLINAFRAQSPACWTGEGWTEWGDRWERELVFSPGLANAAAAHNRHMILSGCFDHVCPGEDGLVQRALAGGYPREFRFVAENIARDFKRARGVFNLWQGSPPHHRTMLFCFARAVGIDRAFGEDALFGWYWTADFGDLVDAQPSASGDESPLEAFDLNGNGRIDDAEALTAIQYWVTGARFRGAVRVDDAAIQTLIARWVSGETIGPGAPRPMIFPMGSL